MVDRQTQLTQLQNSGHSGYCRRFAKWQFGKMPEFRFYKIKAGDEMTKLASKAGIDIHRRLGNGQSPESIAEETGMGLSSVYYHRQRKCVCDKAQAPERSVDIGDDLLVELAELEKILFPDGVPAPTQAVTPPLPPVRGEKK